MPHSSSDEFLRPYREAVARHGPGFEATLWGTPEAQQIRFDVMIELAGLDGCVVMDVGCGRGDFAARLLEQGVAFSHFIGLDALPEVIAAAQERSLDRCTFRVADALEPLALAAGDATPDYVCISGTLNTMDDDSARGLVTAAFDVAAQGIVFNFLSDRPHPRWAGRDLTPARRFDTVAWIAWALGLSSRVGFTQDYLDGHDATIIVRHDEP
jgi:SAM-dependent methyltransferase